MPAATQVNSFGEIHIEAQGRLIINQTVQIAPSEVKSRPYLPASPYLGLEAFDEASSRLFFGRDATILELFQSVPRHPLLMVSGASGSGKSSVVGAGLIPQLRKFVAGFRPFKMKPGSNPFESLKWALIGGGIDGNKLKFAATASPDTIRRVAALRPPSECWLLFIDQFEEMFTVCDRPEYRESFLAGLLALATQQQTAGQLQVVLTMRSDFFDRFDAYPDLLKQIRSGLQFITSPTPDELRQCIEQPAAQHGVVFEDELVDQILSEVKGQPGTLPLLQYMLHLLWEQDRPDDDHTLSKSSYVGIGGVKGSLRQRADAVYEQKEGEPRSPQERELMRQIFLRLVEISGYGDSAPVVSKRRKLHQFSDSEQAVVRELVSEKMLITDASWDAASQPLSPDGAGAHAATVELAHESLLHAWPRLGEWLKEARQVLSVWNRLSQDALTWRRLQKQHAENPGLADEELWAGMRLSQAQELRERGDFRAVLGGLNPDEEAFLAESEARRVAIERAKLAKEQEAKEQLRREREAAEKNRQLLLDSYVDRGHQLLFEKQRPYGAALWFHRAYREGSKNPALPYLLKSAMRFVDATQALLSGHTAPLLRASYSPDGTCVVTASEDGTARVWDSQTGRVLHQLIGHEGGVLCASYSPDGLRIVTTSLDQTGRIWDAQSGQLVAQLTGHTAAVTSASYSPDGLHIVTASQDHTARVWDAQTADLVLLLSGHDDAVVSALYSPDGVFIVTASHDCCAQVFYAHDGQLVSKLGPQPAPLSSARFSPDNCYVLTTCGDEVPRLFETESGSMVTELTGHDSGGRSASYDPDGSYIVTAGESALAYVWEAKDAAMEAQLLGHTASLWCASYSPDGTRIVTASEDQTACIFQVETTTLVAQLVGHGNTVFAACFSPDGSQVLTTSHDHTARIFRADGGPLGPELDGHSESVMSASYSPDGSRIVTASHDGSALVFDSGTGERVVQLSGHESRVVSASYSPDGRHIVTGSDDKTARIWDSQSGTLVMTLAAHTDSVASASYSSDGQYIVTSSADKTVRIWDSQSGRVLRVLEEHPDRITSASHSSDGRYLITGCDDQIVRVFDAASGKLLSTLTGHRAPISSASFSRDGLYVVTASQDGTARVWEFTSRRLIAELLGHEDAVLSACFSPDGLLIATASADQSACLWEAQSGRLLAEFASQGNVFYCASFSPDGQSIVTAHDDGTARVRDVAPETRSVSQIGEILRLRSCLRFEPEDGNVLVACMPPPAELSEKAAAVTHRPDQATAKRDD